MTTTQTSSRPLQGLVVGISVSEAENITAWGYTSADVSRVTVRLCEALLATGARLLFGHDWRPDGIMDAIGRLAVKYQPSGDGNANCPILHSLLPWPNQSSLEPSLRTELEQRGVLKIETMPAPEGDWQSADNPTAVAIALSELRKELAVCCDARVCIGGKEAKEKTDKINGFYAGVVEEAYHTAQADKPVYFGSFLGGASASVAQFLKSQVQPGVAEPSLPPTDPVFQVVPSKADLFHKMKNPFARLTDATSGSSLLNVVTGGLLGKLGAAANEISKAMVESRSKTAHELTEDLSGEFDNQQLQQRSRLSEEEWLQMLKAPDSEAFVTWILRGLRRVAAEKTPGTVQPTSSASAPVTPPSTPPVPSPKRTPRRRRSPQ
ncbi:MAG: hypothetical protein IAG10_30725 [Planctomycetaceae bacterium]|nr:hypothetical protein [Planctomycetaceae bacterium]